ncbi:hypothetical protein ACO0K1_09420 [Undibacterium sp. SXout20W]
MCRPSIYFSLTLVANKLIPRPENVTPEILFNIPASLDELEIVRSTPGSNEQHAASDATKNLPHGEIHAHDLLSLMS